MGGRLKTKQSKAPIPVPEQVRPVIEAWRRLSKDSSSEALMFPTFGRGERKGQQQVFPAAVRNTPILPILTFLPIVIMIFWLLRVGLTKAYKGKWMPRRVDGSSPQT